MENRIMKKIFTPQCLSDDQSYGIDNRNTLIPCCYVDNAGLVTNKLLDDLLKVSNIDDYDSIEDIINQKEWKEFFEHLKKAKETQDIEILKILPRACSKSCMNGDSVRVQKWQD